MTGRIVYAGAFAASLLALWQASRLPMWDVFGPGPGLFPVAATLFCCVVSGALALFPRLARDAHVEAEPEPALSRDDGIVFWGYAAALPLLAVGSAWLGFMVTSLAVALGLTWLAERRRLLGALLLGAGIGLTGVVVFDKLFDARVPVGIVDDLVLRLVR